MCASFSGSKDFVIQLTVHLKAGDSQVSGVLDLSTDVYGKVAITDSVGVPQNLDVHLRKVIADSDKNPGGRDELALISDG